MDSWKNFLKARGEECYGASDGALSLPIHLLLSMAAIYAGSATRNCSQKCKRQDLADKMSISEKSETINCLLHSGND